MKLSDLILAAQAAMEKHGDINVCHAHPDFEPDDSVLMVETTRVRPFGSCYVPASKWDAADMRPVFVLA